jgi:hypothetical protein
MSQGRSRQLADHHDPFGIVLVPLVLPFRDAVRPASPALANSGSAFGPILAGLIIATGMITNVGYSVVSDLHAVDPARAATAWATLDAVQNGLGGGNEVVGGLRVLRLSVAACAHRSCPDGAAISACAWASPA